MSDAARTLTSAREHLRIARLLEASGDVIGAICAYREVVRAGPEGAATEALLRIAALARRA
jgi:predicted TPR repeat methyltransferase